MSYDPSKPSLVPELVLKKKANLERLSLARQDRLANQGNRKVFKKRNNVVKVRKPEAFVASKRGKINNNNRYKRVKKKGLQGRKRRAGEVVEKLVDEDTGEVVESDNEDDLDDERKIKTVTLALNSLRSPVVFCVRIRPDDSHTPSTVRKTLSKYRLRNENDGVFVRYTSDTRRELEAVEQYVAYGVIGEGVCKELISRRGFVKKLQGGGKERIPLNNNVIVEETIGDTTGCICVDDVVKELLEPTESFREVSNFLWPFKLSGEESGFERRKLGYRNNGKEGYGDRGERMEEFVKKVM